MNKKNMKGLNMEITIIHGQNHRGSSYNIASMLKDELSNKDTIIHEFMLPTDGPDFCVGCFNCIERDELKCPHVEKTRPLYEAIIKSKIIIFDSPTYCLEMSGQLKAFFDHFGYLWLPHRPREEMFNKIGVSIATTARAGAKGVTKAISKQMFWMGIPKTYQLSYAVAASSWENVNDKLKSKINKDIKRLVKKINKKIKKVKVGFRTKFLFNIMRLMHKNNAWN